jgi:hypothetical protein
MLLEFWFFCPQFPIIYFSLAILLQLLHPFETTFRSFLFHHVSIYTTAILMGAMNGIRMGSTISCFGIVILVPILTSIIYQLNKSSYQHLYVQIDENGAEYGSSEFKLYFDWLKVRKIVRNSAIIIIQVWHPFMCPTMPIPIRAFENEQQAEAFYQTAHTYWQAKRTP